MSKVNPRQIAVDILDRVEKGGYAEPLIDQALSQGEFQNSPDRRLLTQLVYGTLRMRGRLDWYLAKLYQGRVEKMEPALRNLIRTGLYQIFLMDRIPGHAAVDESVRIASKRFPGRTGLVNAILRNAIRQAGGIAFPDFEEEPIRHIAAFHSHPEWLVERWIEAFGVEETLALCQADNENPSICLRVNTLKASRDEALAGLTADGYEARPTAFSPDGLELLHSPRPIRENTAFGKGQIQIQDEASQLVTRLLDPAPGSRVLDLCAGIGGKTTHLAALMRNQGEILAVDIHANKLNDLGTLAKRLGASIIRGRAADATADLGPDCHERFDAVLIDAPCSGLGTLRRNPEIKWRLTPEDLTGCTGLQRALLDRAACYVKPRGILVYSTCSIMPEENEAIVRAFLNTHPDFQLASLPEGIATELIDSVGIFRSFPHRHHTDGFFAARLRRVIS